MPDESSTLDGALAANFAAAGIDPTSDAPLPTTESSTSTRSAPRADEDMLNTLLEHSEQPAETAEAPPEEAAPAEQTPDVLAYMRDKHGLDRTTKYKDTDSFIQGYANLEKKLSERDEYANLGRMARENPEQLLALYKQHGILRDPEPAPAPEPPKSEAPSGFNENWLRYFERGRVTDDAPPEVRKGIETWLRDRVVTSTPAYQDLARKYQDLEAKLSKQPQASPEGVTRADLAAIEGKRYAEAWLAANQDKLFTVANNVRVWKPEGSVFYDALTEKANAGWDTMAALEYAEMKRDQYLAKAAPAPKPTTKTNTRVAEPSRPAPGKGDPLIREGEDLLGSLYRQFGVEQYA